MGKYSPQVKEKDIIAEDVAIEQFMLFVNYYGLDLDEIAKRASEKLVEMGEKPTTADEIGDTYVESIRKGHYSIIENSDGDVVIKQHLIKPVGDFEDVTYGVVRGRNKNDMGKTGVNDKTVQTTALLNSLSGNAGKFVEKLVGRDFTIAMNIGSLYFLV